MPRVTRRAVRGAPRLWLPPWNKAAPRAHRMEVLLELSRRESRAWRHLTGVWWQDAARDSAGDSWMTRIFERQGCFLSEDIHRLVKRAPSERAAHT